MPYNLIEEPWIPLRRTSGAIEWRPPWAVSDPGPGGKDPYVAVAAARPDLSGALVQFLIGLVQTTAPPADDRAWRDWWKKPPPPEELRQHFAKAAHAFNLDGPGPRFLQTPLIGKPKRWPIGQILMDQPGEKTQEENKALFNKPQDFALCPACLAASLYCLQTNAPEGGAGKYVSLRGGGPLTTLVLGATFWETLWLGVLPKDLFWAKRPPSDLMSPDLFRWMGAPLSDEATEFRTPMDSDPAYAYWAMPRRIWADFDVAKAHTACSLCRRENVTPVTSFCDRPKGIKHPGGWQHPLSPHYLKDGQPGAIKGKSSGVCYQDWLGLVLTDQDKNNLPAQVVREFFQHRWPAYAELLNKVSGRSGGQPQLWAFGYDMNSMKATGWTESLMPMVLVAKEHEEDFAQAVTGLVKTAEQAAYSLASALKKAWFPDGVKVKISQGDLGRVSLQLWEVTEADFYSALDRLKALLEEGRPWQSPSDADLDSVMDDFKKDWLKTLSQAAQTIFHDYSQETQMGKVQDPKRIACAGLDLRRFLGSRQDKLRGLLALPLLEKKPKASRSKKQGGGK